jgi:hypothetical protein
LPPLIVEGTEITSRPLRFSPGKARSLTSNEIEYQASGKPVSSMLWACGSVPVFSAVMMNSARWPGLTDRLSGSSETWIKGD